MECYGKKGAKHLYELEVRETGSDAPSPEWKRIEVYAENRTQAEKIARMAGYEACSVNMIG